MKKSALTIIILVIALMALIGWRLVTKQKASIALNASQKAQFSAPPAVAVAVAKGGSIQDQIQSLGTVVSPNTVNISSRITGLITYLQVRPGSHVMPGQKIVQIDPSQISGLVYQSEANLAAAKAKLAQSQLSQNSNSVSVSATIAQQNAALASAQADDNQAHATYQATIATAKAQVIDARAKVSAAQAVARASGSSILSAKASLNDATTKFNRTYALYKQDFVAAQDVDDAKTAVQVAQSAVAVAESNQASTNAAVISAKAALDVAQKQEAITIETAKANLTASDAKLLQAQQQAKIARANTSANPAYQENLNALQAAVTAAQGSLDQSRAQLAETEISSPIAGVVTARNIDPGSVVTSGQTILVVQSLNSVFVNASIPIEKSSEVFTGQLAKIAIDGIKGKTFTGRIAHISPAADQTTRQFLIQISIPNPTEIFKPGMFGQVTINVQTSNSPVTVPREAIFYDPKKNPYVFVVDSQNKVHQTPVTLGMNNAVSYEITSGLQPGEKVVTLAYNPLKDGEIVNPAKNSSGL